MEDCIKFTFDDSLSEHKENIPTHDYLIKKLQYNTITKNNLMNYDINEIELKYNNYDITELLHIYNYYRENIGKYQILSIIKTNNKNELVNAIINFETNIDNLEIISKRKEIWKQIQNIKNDKYLSKYLIL
jgi:hypothetical protein